MELTDFLISLHEYPTILKRDDLVTLLSLLNHHPKQEQKNWN